MRSTPRTVGHTRTCAIDLPRFSLAGSKEATRGMGESNGQFNHMLSLTCRDDGSGSLRARVFDAPNTMHISLGTLELCPTQQHVEDDEVHGVHRCAGSNEGGQATP